MRLGWYISGAGHLALILVVLFGGLFAGDRIPEVVTLSNISILSEDDLAALTPPGEAPDTQTDAPDVAAPDEDQAPDAPEPDEAPPAPEARPIETPDAQDAPDVEVDGPVPNAVVVDDVPLLAPPSDLDGSAPEPDQVAAPAPRVAPVPQVAPPPDVEAGPEVNATAPDPEAPPDEPQPEDPPAAPEAASDRIVTEAEEEKDLRPRQFAPPARTARTPGPTGRATGRAGPPQHG